MLMPGVPARWKVLGKRVAGRLERSFFWRLDQYLTKVTGRTCLGVTGPDISAMFWRLAAKPVSRRS